MILAITAVNDYKLENLERFENGVWDIHVLTDKPDKFNKWNTHNYNNNVFSFFDKLLFPFRLSKKYKKSVVSIDADDLYKPSIEFINNFIFTKRGKDVMYPSEWPDCQDLNLGGILESGLYPDSMTRLKYVIEHWEMLGYDYKKLKPIWEWMLYIAYNDKIEHIIHEIEYVKPLFECGTVMSNLHYYGGNGTYGTVYGSEEGLALSYALDLCGIESEKFNPIYITQ